MNFYSDVWISEVYRIILLDKGKEWNIAPPGKVLRACFQGAILLRKIGLCLGERKKETVLSESWDLMTYFITLGMTMLKSPLVFQRKHGCLQKTEWNQTILVGIALIPTDCLIVTAPSSTNTKPLKGLFLCDINSTLEAEPKFWHAWNPKLCFAILVS